MLVTKEQHLIDVIGGLKNAEVRLVTITPKKALQKSRLTGEATPDNLQEITKIAIRENQMIAMEYETLIKKMRFKEAGILGKVKKIFFGDDFKTVDTYTEPVTDNHAVLRHKTTKKVYVRTYARQDAAVCSEYYDGAHQLITDQWKILEQEYFAKRGANKSQGLEEPIIVNNTALEHIEYIEDMKTGEVLYNNLCREHLKMLNLNTIN